MPDLRARVVAGLLKGRVLELPHSDAVRPTRNLVLQAVFNVLESRLLWDGMRVADVCCGSGAWGIEAASRGAGEVVLVDRDVAAVRRNVAVMQPAVPGCVMAVVGADARAWAAAVEVPFDVVLSDPPYDSEIVAQLVEQRARLGRAGTLWCVEVARGTELVWPEDMTVLVCRDYGSARVVVVEQG